MQEKHAHARQRSAMDAIPQGTPRFRAEADDLGRWFVWQRLGATGWAAWRACRSRSDAVELAASLNQGRPAAPN